MNKVEAYLHEFPGWSWRFEWSGPFDLSAARWNQHVLAAVDALRDLFEPLAVELRLARIGESYPREESWSADLLLAAELAPGDALTPAVTSATVTTVSSLHQDELERQLQRLIIERDAPSIMRLEVHASRAFLAAPARLFELEVAPGSVIQLLVDEDAQKPGVVGPHERYPFQPPVGLVIDDSLSVRLNVHWSYWSKGPGNPALQDACNKLAGLGWSLAQEPGGPR